MSPWRRVTHGEDGLVREAVVLFVLVSLFALVLLDVLAVYNTRRAVKDIAKNAADEAAAAFVTTGSDTAAQQAATTYLDTHDTRLVAFVVNRSIGETVYKVTATRTAKTRLFKYLGHLPKVGKWIDRQLSPEASADTL